MTVSGVAASVRHLAASGSLDLPRPGGGRTAERHRQLLELTRHHPVSVGRLAEAHTDATAILAEAGRRPDPDALYGVWASQAPGEGVVVDLADHTLRGTASFCSGVGLLDRALLTVTDEGREQWLVDVGVSAAPTVRWSTAAWSTPALHDTLTGSITFDGHALGGDAVIGPPRWYLERAGFWPGACGPAACWAGGALGLVDAAGRYVGDDRHRQEALGTMRAQAWGLRALLARAGDEIDAHRCDPAGTRHRVLALRLLVERACADVLDHFGQSFGPRPFVTDAEVAQRFSDVHLYLRQQHGQRDLADLGTAPPFEDAATEVVAR